MSLLSYETSQNMLELLQVPLNRFEKVPLSSSLGRILAEDIIAQYNDPQFPTASMDGYAIKHEDMGEENIIILGDNPAGHHEERKVAKGESIKTFTGSMMPNGTDTLVPIENVDYKDKKIHIIQKVVSGFSVRPIGEGYRMGDTLIAKGTKISFAEIGVMAGLNKVMVSVVLRPRVAIIATGSEILDLGENSTNPAQIRSSNNYTLAALFEQAGAEVIQLGTAPDDKVSLMATFENALSSADILVSTGGVSVGDYDFVKDIIPRLGAEVVFKGVSIKPGRHVLLAKKEEKFLLALPGFAYSSTVTAILYGLPLVAKILGTHEPFKIIAAKLRSDFKKRSPYTEFTACNLTLEDGQYYVDFEGKKTGSSAILVNMLSQSVLMIAGEEDKFLEAGMLVSVVVF